jgi:hypothetical protein
MKSKKKQTKRIISFIFILNKKQQIYGIFFSFTSYEYIKIDIIKNQLDVTMHSSSS